VASSATPKGAILPDLVAALHNNQVDFALDRAISDFTGQNGKVYDTEPVLAAQCGKKK
jgi:hypothetical protein